MKAKSKISWVKWSDVCKLKKDDGLGVRVFHVVNLSLSTKWRWCLLSGVSGLWVDILVSRYSLYRVS